MKRIDVDDAGAYEIITSAGAYVIIDLDTREAIRHPGLIEPRPGFSVNEIGFVNGWWQEVTLDAPVVVGEAIRLHCAPPQNWYTSTPVTSITKIDSPFYGRD